MKKKLIGLVIALALCCNLLGIAGLTSRADVAPESAATIEEAVYTELAERFDESDRDVSVGYLLRENFSPYGAAGSGWEKVNMPNGSGVAKIESQNTSLETYIKKAFVAQTGEVTVELKAILISSVENGFITVLGNKDGREVNAVAIKIENDALKLVTGSGEKITVGKITNANWTGLKIVANPTDDTVTVFVNGAAYPAATNVGLSSACSSLTGLKIGIAAASKGSYTLGTVSVYKGYDVHETLAVAGVNTVFDVDHDYNTTATVTATVDDHSIGNNNAHLGYLAFDNDDTTYWENNKNYTISKNAYFMASYGNNVVPIDTVRLKFAGYYKGIINVTYQRSDDSWDGWGEGKYSWVKYETTEDNDYELILTLDEPRYLVELAIGFMVGADGYDIANQDIKLASFEAKCQNPQQEEMPSFPSDWTKTTPDNTAAETYAFYGASSVAEFNVFRFKDDNATESVKAEKAFARKGSVTAEYAAYFADKADGNRVGLTTQNGDFAGIVTKDGKFNVSVIAGGEEKLVPLVNTDAALGDFTTDLWLRFVLKFDAATDSLTVDYNGWSPIGAVPLGEAFRDCTWTAFTATTATGVTEMMLDNVKVYATQKESDVPALEKCDTGDTILTMQACSLWREGTHVGWASLDNEKMFYRQPILGWYDEGTAEVADWEIKMAADHGISNFMYCWYRYNVAEGPILGSNYADEIWDGLFKSKFRDEMKFTIMFENSNTSSVQGYDDLVNDLMPYWIEVFFKNPNYQKTSDGKPIFYIYSYSQFINGIGDVNEDGQTNAADAKIAVDKMREMCVEAGLPGLYVAAEDRAQSATTVRTIENCGFDSLFAYTFSTGTYNNSNDGELAHAQNILSAQRSAITNADAFAVIPNISKSWDTRGWTNYGFSTASASYMYDLEHYRQYALWVKNVFGGAVLDDAGTKMIMLDNWNEFSEGHWLLPTYGTAAYKDGRYTYGYLDVLREVFGIGQFDHTDYMPLEDGFGPYDTWYPTGWEQTLNMYGDLFGNAEDHSVRESGIVDWEIGYDTMGGTTAYVHAVTGSEADLADTNRVVFDSAAVAALKAADADFTVKMKYGEIKLTKAQIATLDANKSFEIVFNMQIDLTDVAVAVRKTAQNAYRICDGEVYTFSLKQGGYALADYSVQITFAAVSEKATGYALFADGTLAKSETAVENNTLTVENNTQIVFVK